MERRHPLELQRRGVTAGGVDLVLVLDALLDELVEIDVVLVPKIVPPTPGALGTLFGPEATWAEGHGRRRKYRS